MLKSRNINIFFVLILGFLSVKFLVAGSDENSSADVSESIEIKSPDNYLALLKEAIRFIENQETKIDETRKDFLVNTHKQKRSNSFKKPFNPQTRWGKRMETLVGKTLARNAKFNTQTSDNKKMTKEKSAAISLTDCLSHPSETFQRLVLGIHSKTKRTLAEEAESGDELSMSSWIRDGTDPNELDSYGYTPLLNASANGRLKAVKNLIRNGADINKTGPFLYTPLHAAAQKGHQEIVSFLIKNGANLNAQNQDNDTALHLALKEQHFEVINELVKHGINTRIEGFNNKNSIQLANSIGLVELAQLLEN